ncbi:DNA repair protein RadC [Candidatus Binatia bacterium]|nr:DNA repair protein RadC [Candidatus Binatia bacterium]
MTASSTPLLDGIEPPRGGPVRRIRVYAVRERSTSERPRLSSPREVWQLLAGDVAGWDRERFLTLALDSANRLIGIETVSTGTLNATTVHPREIFKGLILANAAAFIAVHNHPSGQVKPSAEDREVTKRLAEAGDLLGIRLLDHVVLSADAFHSFADCGEMPSTGGPRR